LERWLQTFPSYGYILSVAPAQVAAVIARFARRGIAAADIGAIAAGRRVAITDGRTSETVWDFAREPLIGCGQLQFEDAQVPA
jgi:selenophosphate synthetase-related protein